MVRVQIQLDEAEYQQIQALAHRNKISISEAIRELVCHSLPKNVRKNRPGGVKTLLSIAGIAVGGVNDLGRRHDDYLAETYNK